MTGYIPNFPDIDPSISIGNEDRTSGGAPITFASTQLIPVTINGVTTNYGPYTSSVFTYLYDLAWKNSGGSASGAAALFTTYRDDFVNYSKEPSNYHTTSDPSGLARFIYGYYKTYHYDTSVSSEPTVGELNNSGLYQAFINDYTESRGTSPDFSSGDLSIIIPALQQLDPSTPALNNLSLFPSFFGANILATNANVTFDDFSSANIKNPVLTFFNQSFKTIFSANNGLPGSSPSAPDGFFFQWNNLLTTDVLIQDPSNTYWNGLSPSSNPFVNVPIPTYKGTYQHMTGDKTQSGFESAFQTFFINQIVQNGYFDPSKMFDSWSAYIIPIGVTNLQNSFQHFIPPISSTLLANNDSEKVIILNNLIYLLIQIIGTIQKVGIAQAAQINFLTKYQNVYTQLQQQIPVFLQDGTPIIGVAGTQASTARTDLNSTYNANVTSNLQSLRTVEENSAKQMQANVDQTNNQVNQIADAVSTLIQQLVALLNTCLHPS